MQEAPEFAHYVAERKKLEDIVKESQNGYDRTVLWLAGGAMAVSLSFVGGLAALGPLTAGWLLFLAWLPLVVSLFAMLLSFWASRNAAVAALELADHEERIRQGCNRENEEIIVKTLMGDETRQRLADNETRLCRTVDRRNKTGGFALAIGVVLLLLFAALNLGRLNMPATNDREIRPIQDGVEKHGQVPTRPAVKPPKPTPPQKPDKPGK
jgi:hypothetical protein